MRSNWQIWDFARSQPQLVEVDRPGCYALNSFDPFIEKMVVDTLPKKIIGNFQVFVGSEITPDWLQDNLATLTLFGNQESRLILLAEEIPSKSWDLLKEMSSGVDQFYLLLSFSKNSTLFDDLGKNDLWSCFKIDAPKFWEQGKLLNFICQRLNVRLSFDVQSYILEKIEPLPSKYIGCLKNLILQTPGGREINDLALVDSVLATEHFDKFKVAKLYGQKKFANCFETVLSANPVPSVLEDFFTFMFSYLTSLGDTTQIEKKSYKSKYDKELLSFSKLWKDNEIQSSMKLFRDLLLASKKRDPRLKDLLRLSYLGQF